MPSATNNTFTVGIEAKVSETLDARVIEKLDEARAKFDIGETTNEPVAIGAEREAGVLQSVAM